MHVSRESAPLTYEEERGKPIPGKNHAIVQIRLGAEFLQQTQLVFSELSLQVGFDKIRVPDLCVFSHGTIDFRHDEVNVGDPPETVVEIFSPTQPSQDVMDKLDEYFAFGVKSVWVVSPPLRHVTIFAADGREARFTAGMALDPVTGLMADLDKVFRSLPGLP
ncbi:MAG: Uma2 family endonuclease [Verrucomicrobiaceae bacterium]|nr:MAG: Uma2 family endonuclease [Verrucomicrobiaceae bacterium]